MGSGSDGLSLDKACQLRRSTQHLLEVYSQESGILKSFWDGEHCWSLKFQGSQIVRLGEPLLGI
jgi:hypothetical protein